MNFLEQVLEIAKETFNDDDISIDSKIEDAKGFDSMALVQFIIELETNLDIRIDEDEIPRTLSFKELNDILVNKSQA